MEKYSYAVSFGSSMTFWFFSSMQQQQPKSASYMFKDHLSKHHKPVERNGCALQPVSPASYNSLMDVSIYIFSSEPWAVLCYIIRILSTITFNYIFSIICLAFLGHFPLEHV